MHGDNMYSLAVRVVGGALSVAYLGAGGCTLLPNLMMCDAGGRRARMATYLGMAASAAAICAGAGGVLAALFAPAYLASVHALMVAAVGGQVAAFATMLAADGGMW